MRYVVELAMVSVLCGACFSAAAQEGGRKSSASELRTLAMKRVLQNPEQTLAWAQGIQDKEARSYVLDGMVVACQDTNPALAEAIWRSMGPDDVRTPYTIAYVIRGWAGKGAVRRAEALARSVGDAKRRSELLADAVGGLTGRKSPYMPARLREAERVARSIEDEQVRMQQLQYLSLCWVGLDPKKAEAVARSIEDAGARLDARYRVAYDLSGHDVQKAAALAKSLYPLLQDRDKRQALLRRVYVGYGDRDAFWRWAAAFSAEDRAFLKAVEEEHKPPWERVPGVL